MDNEVLQSEAEPKFNDNISEYIKNNGITNITFVFAHPDDLDGYAAGLLNNLVSQEGVIDPRNIRLIVATDGANGTKDLQLRAELDKIRKEEQLNSANKLGWSHALENTKFIDLIDGNIDAERLDRELQQEFDTYDAGTAHLVITHDLHSWGAPDNRTPEQMEEYVQNHPDHRTTARSVEQLLKQQNQTRKKPIKLLEATWDSKEASVISAYDKGIKKNAFSSHESQYLQNQESMDLIEDRLNNYGDNKRYEFFREVNLTELTPLENSLLALTGKVLDEPVYTMGAIMQKHNIKAERVITINAKHDVKLPLGREFTTTAEYKSLRLSLIEMIRKNLADLLIIEDSSPEILEVVDKIMMFDASIALEGVSEEPKAIRMLMLGDTQGNVVYNGGKYRFIKGLW